MKLLLTSNGLTTPIIQRTFLELVGKPAAEIKVALIPTAGDPEAEENFLHQTLDELRLIGDLMTKVFELRGIGQVDIIDLKNTSPEKLLNTLKPYDVILVNGGNTFFLLYWARKSGFMSVVKTLLGQGKVYVGVSAGSILATPSIDVAGWKGVGDPNLVHDEDLSALNVVNFHIFPHFQEKWRKISEKKAIQLGKEVMYLKNGQAIVVDGEKRWQI